MKVVVLTKSYLAALGIGRSLELGDISEIDLVFIGAKNASVVQASNVFSEVTVLPSRNDPEIVEKLIELYGNSGEGRPVLFPGDDYTTSLADRYREKLDPIFLMTYVDGYEPGAVTKLMDKGYQAEAAPQFGLKTVESKVASFNGTEFEIPEGISYPCFVKPLVSANGLAKANMARCDNERELISHLRGLVKLKETNPVIIQKFIKIEEEYNIHGICDGDRLFIPVIHRKLETCRHSMGVTILGMNMAPSHLEPELDKLKKMLLTLGYHGVINVEMFRENGQTYLNEINLRIAGTCWGPAGSGANISKLWVQCLNGELTEWPELDIKFNTVFINDKTAFEDLIYRIRTRKEFNEWNRRAEYHLVQSDRDPAPWNEFKKIMKREKRKATKKKIKKLILKFMRK